MNSYKYKSGANDFIWFMKPANLNYINYAAQIRVEQLFFHQETTLCTVLNSPGHSPLVVELTPHSKFALETVFLNQMGVFSCSVILHLCGRMMLKVELLWSVEGEGSLEKKNKSTRWVQTTRTSVTGYVCWNAQVTCLNNFVTINALRFSCFAQNF